MNDKDKTEKELKEEEMGSNILEAMGFLLGEEFNKCSIMYNKTMDLPVKGLLSQRMDYIKKLLNNLGIDYKEDGFKKEGGNKIGKSKLN